MHIFIRNAVSSTLPLHRGKYNYFNTPTGDARARLEDVICSYRYDFVSKLTRCSNLDKSTRGKRGIYIHGSSVTPASCFLRLLHYREAPKTGAARALHHRALTCGNACAFGIINYIF